MNRIALIAAVVAGAASLVGCSENTTKLAPKLATVTGAMTVQGSVSSKLGTDNARAVAIGDNGRQVWTYLDAHGDFTLKLPLGTSYRVLIANQIVGGSQKVIGKVSIPTGAGTPWINANKVATVDLGVLRKPDATPAAAPAAAAAAPAAGTTTTQSLHVSDYGSSGNSGGSWGGGDDDDSGAWGAGSSSGGSSGGAWGAGSSSGGSSGGAWGGGGVSSSSGSGSWGGGGVSGSSGSSGGSWGGGGSDGYSDDGFDSCYSYNDGGWSDSASGWDNGATDAPSNHSDDNPCFGGGDDDDDDNYGASSSSSGAVGGGGSTGISPGNICDVCSGGADAVILAPSNSGCGAFGDTSVQNATYPESQACPISFGTASTTATDGGAATTSSSSSSGTVNTLAGEGLAAAPASGSVGDACVVKAQCGTGSCVANKCAN